MFFKKNSNLNFIGSILFAVTVLVGGFFVNNTVFATDTGQRNPTVAESVDAATGTGWKSNTLTNALTISETPTVLSADLTSALAASPASAHISKYLKLTGFEFSIPTDATIVGIEVSVTRRGNSLSADFIKDNSIILTGGTGNSADKAFAIPWSASASVYTTQTYGNATDMWATTWTPSQINNVAFGLEISVQNIDTESAHGAHVDGATITVYYTTVLTVSSASSIADISVVNGTTLSDVGLPSNTTVTLSDSTTPSYEVTWDGGSPTYDSTTAGTYVFTGTLTLPDGVFNPGGVTANVNVIVATGDGGNDEGGLETQATPIFSPGAEAIKWGTTVIIISSGADAIYYTTNGDTPTTSSTNQDSTPLVINGEVTVKALAVKTGLLNSAIGSASYTQATSANLTNVVLSGTPSNYTFASETYNYNNVTVTNDVSNITITPTGTGVITVDEVTVATGVAYDTIALTEGTEKTITVITTETGKSAKTYIIKITRALASHRTSGSYIKFIPATPVTGQVLGAEKFNFTKFLKFKAFSYKVSLQGIEVMELQKLLNNSGDTLIIDGKFGPKTKGAVIKFQKANKLVGDGIVGAKTRAVLNK